MKLVDDGVGCRVQEKKENEKESREKRCGTFVFNV
jgi:hypothetical protein